MIIKNYKQLTIPVSGSRSTPGSPGEPGGPGNPAGPGLPGRPVFPGAPFGPCIYWSHSPCNRKGMIFIVFEVLLN